MRIASILHPLNGIYIAYSISFYSLMLAERWKRRDKITFRISMGAVGLSYSFLALVFQVWLTQGSIPITPRVALSAIGYYIAFGGLAWREFTLWHTSEEGGMPKDENYTAHASRIAKSSMFRVGQMSPMIVWAGIANLELEIVVGIFPLFVILAYLLARHEHYNLWR